MKKIICIIICGFIYIHITSKAVCQAQNSGSFTLGGNANTFYPVAFDDGSWEEEKATTLELAHPRVHEGGNWYGSMVAVFRFHTTRWGNGSDFIDADIKQYNSVNSNKFIAGWTDVTVQSNTDPKVIIWLRGATRYMFHSSCPQTPLYNNGELTIDGTKYPIKTSVDPIVNSFGKTFAQNIWVTGPHPSFFEGNVGIGTNSPDYKLDVVGTIRSHEILVNTQKGADFVFEENYSLRPLSEVEAFITTNKHLPEIEPAQKMEQEGLNISEFQIKLLQKIEELTLYMIEQEKTNKEQQKIIEEQSQLNKELELRIKALEKR